MTAPTASRAAQPLHGSAHPYAGGKDRRSGNEHVRSGSDCQRSGCFINSTIYFQFTSGLELLNHLTDTTYLWQRGMKERPPNCSSTRMTAFSFLAAAISSVWVAVKSPCQPNIF